MIRDCCRMPVRLACVIILDTISNEVIHRIAKFNILQWPVRVCVRPWCIHGRDVKLN